MNERNTFIVRVGEVALKGQNKPYFEKTLVDRIRRLLKKYQGVEVTRHEGLIFVYADKDIPEDTIISEIRKVFGVASISPAVSTEPHMEAIGKAAVDYMMNLIDKKGIKTFKVDAKRADKSFPIKSPDIARQV
ncbi:MAG: tRNA 4-thiouridine(8) synthase ThiI, partial [Firmicutes bacterium]|nr:tRNA 4-thiouridine(8) synthase ThiI [Bacillota bacterium]